MSTATLSDADIVALFFTWGEHIMTKTYTRTFSRAGRRWVCTFDVSITEAYMSWSPKCPPEATAIWREYRRWRDRCLQDFAQRNGVLHEITGDLPWVGLRIRFSRPLTREAAYRVARAYHAELSDKSRCTESAPSVRERMLKEFGAEMLATAPDGVMH